MSDIKLTAQIHPSGSWGIVDINEVKGGIHYADTYNDMRAISKRRLVAGMMCYVIKEQSYYKWTGSDWTPIDFGGQAKGGISIVTPSQLKEFNPTSYDQALYDSSVVKQGEIIYVLPGTIKDEETGEDISVGDYYAQAILIDSSIEYNDGDGQNIVRDGLSNLVTQAQVVNDINPEELVDSSAWKIPTVNTVSKMIKDSGCDCVLTHNAQVYYQEQYDAMFTYKLAWSASLSASPSSFNAGTPTTVTLTAKIPAFTCKNGMGESNTPTFTSTCSDDSWTKVSEQEYTKKVTYGDDGQYTSDSVSISIPLTITLDEEEGISYDKTCDTKTPSTAITIKNKASWYFNSVSDTIEALQVELGDTNIAQVFVNGGASGVKISENGKFEGNLELQTKQDNYTWFILYKNTGATIENKIGNFKDDTINQPYTTTFGQYNVYRSLNALGGDIESLTIK